MSERKKECDLKIGEYVLGHFHCKSNHPSGVRGTGDNLEVFSDEASAKDAASELNAEMHNTLGDDAVNAIGETEWLWHPMKVEKDGTVPSVEFGYTEEKTETKK